MKNRKNYVMAKSNPTLTQSGLLAILLRRQRYKKIADRSFPFRRDFEGSVPRGTLEIFNQANSHVSPNPYLH
jgi:hypothetical protein